MWYDMGQLVGAVLLIVGAMLPVVNPLGDAPIFLAMTAGYDRSTRAELAKRISLYSFSLMLGSMLLGSFVLRLFGLSIPLVQVAGGAVVCSLSWALLTDNPKPADANSSHANARDVALGRAFYPMTMPITIDAGVISVAITVGANHSYTVEHMLIQLIAAIIGAAILTLTILVTYLYAEPVSERIGRTGMMVVLRLSAFIMLCIGVGICWNGIKSLLVEVGIQR